MGRLAVFEHLWASNLFVRCVLKGGTTMHAKNPNVNDIDSLVFMFHLTSVGLDPVAALFEQGRIPVVALFRQLVFMHKPQ